MLLQTAVIATAALGLTLVILSGGIDLSVGAQIALATSGSADRSRETWAPRRRLRLPFPGRSQPAASQPNGEAEQAAGNDPEHRWLGNRGARPKLHFCASSGPFRERAPAGPGLPTK